MATLSHAKRCGHFNKTKKKNTKKTLYGDLVARQALALTL
jgi:hypothetical protein